MMVFIWNIVCSVFVNLFYWLTTLLPCLVGISLHAEVIHILHPYSVEANDLFCPPDVTLRKLHQFWHHSLPGITCEQLSSQQAMLNMWYQAFNWWEGMVLLWSKWQSLFLRPTPPSLPDEFNTFLRPPAISSLSQKLNLIFLCHNGTCTCFPYPWGPQLCCCCRVNILPSLYASIRQYCCLLDAIWWFEVLFIPHYTYMRDILLLWIWAIQTSLTQYNPFASSVQSLQNL